MLDFERIEDGVRVRRSQCAQPVVVIPSEWNGTPVVEVGACAFSDTFHVDG